MDEGQAFEACRGARRHFYRGKMTHKNKSEKWRCYECRKIGHLSKEGPLKDSMNRFVGKH